jgi:hypothetical protein
MANLVVGRIVPAKYMYSPVYRHQLVRQLPRQLRNMITAQRRDVSLVNQLLEKLVDMGLVQVDGNLQTNRRRDQVFINLSDSATILDTTVCIPRSSFFSQQCTLPLQTRHLYFDLSGGGGTLLVPNSKCVFTNTYSTCGEESVEIEVDEKEEGHTSPVCR